MLFFSVSSESPSSDRWYTWPMKYSLSRVSGLFRGGTSLLIHLLWPCSCLFCGALGEVCCASCLDAYMARHGGQTSRFGDPPLDIAYGSLYRGRGRELVHRLKYRDEAVLGKLLGEALGRHFHALLEGGTFIPLPLHHKSPRSYNQALLLARGAARACGGSVWDCLFWKNETEPQTGKNRAQRQALSSEALGFSGISRKKRPLPLVLVDDVSTTGTTLKAAAGILGKQGYEVSLGVVCCFAPSGGDSSMTEGA